MTDQNLASLIDQAFARHETTSGAKLARLAQQRGHDIVATTINHIRAGTYVPHPRKATLAAIAWLANVPIAVAYEAAGLPVPGPSFAEQLPDGVDYLTPAERQAVIGLLRVLIDGHDELKETPSAS